MLGSDIERSLDHVVYTAIVGSIKTEAVARYARTIENEGVFGKGKIALLLLDRECACAREVRTLEAQNTLKSRTYKSMDELASFLSVLKLVDIAIVECHPQALLSRADHGSGVPGAPEVDVDARSSADIDATNGVG